jgi:hypothetical protein
MLSRHDGVCRRAVRPAGGAPVAEHRTLRHDGARGAAHQAVAARGGTPQDAVAVPVRDAIPPLDPAGAVPEFSGVPAAVSTAEDLAWPRGSVAVRLRWLVAAALAEGPIPDGERLRDRFHAVVILRRATSDDRGGGRRDRAQA